MEMRLRVREPGKEAYGGLAASWLLRYLAHAIPYKGEAWLVDSEDVSVVHNDVARSSFIIQFQVGRYHGGPMPESQR